MPVLLATRNAHKLDELRRILSGVVEAELVGLAEVPAYEELPETGATFVENALLKARAGAAASGLVTIADDSGLCADALGGMPGVLSARWAGAHGDDAANLDLVLGQLADVPEGRRQAQFVCAAVAVTPDGREVSALGVVRGSLLRERLGENGFGYDPIFVPHGGTRTTAQLSPAEKDALSHRGIAFRELAPLLAELLR
jgi:XTP/dITP diphosphohydrolase